MTKPEKKTFSPKLEFPKKLYKELEGVAKKKGLSKTALVFGYILDGLAQE